MVVRTNLHTREPVLQKQSRRVNQKIPDESATNYLQNNSKNYSYEE